MVEVLIAMTTAHRHRVVLPLLLLLLFGGFLSGEVSSFVPRVAASLSSAARVSSSARVASLSSAKTNTVRNRNGGNHNAVRSKNHDNNDDNNVAFFGTALQDAVLGHPAAAAATTTLPETAGNVSAVVLSSDNNDPITDNNNNNIVRGYWCDYCNCGFNKKKSYLEHIKGKRHNAIISEGERVWKEYNTKRHAAFYDASVAKMDVARAWSLDSFVEGMPARTRSSKKKAVSNQMVGGMVTNGRLTLASSSAGSNNGALIGNNARGGGGNQIDPSVRVADLPPSKRAALFRYLHETTSGVPHLVDAVAALPPRYARVKELLESVEVFRSVVATILKRSTVRGRKAKRISRVYDTGCGHGLVGMFIAAAYPHIEVHSIDLVARDSYLAHRDAFRSAGIPLDNLSFRTGDLSLIGRNNNHDDETPTTVRSDDRRIDHNHREEEKEDDTTAADDNNTLMLCVHGCKELTHESIELARDNDWAWFAVPCCLQAGDFLRGGTTSLKIPSDHTRYAMLCGAIAAKYHPESVTTIDSRVTGRGIVLASSGG